MFSSEVYCCIEEVCWSVYVGRFPVTHLSNFLSTSSASAVCLSENVSGLSDDAGCHSLLAGSSHEDHICYRFICSIYCFLISFEEAMLHGWMQMTHLSVTWIIKVWHMIATHLIFSSLFQSVVENAALPCFRCTFYWLNLTEPVRESMRIRNTWQVHNKYM